jgi:hypothetical protein
MPSPAQERAERLFQQKQEGAKALTDYEAKEQATRLLTAKLRAERLARESKPQQKRKAYKPSRDHTAPSA